MPGDKLVSHDGKQVEVLSVKLQRVDEVEVFNLTVYNTHTFAVGDDSLLAHNQSWCDIMAEKGMGDKPPELHDLIGTAITPRGKLLTEASIHGHHIVMKRSCSRNATGKGWYVNRSQGILERFDIKLLGTKEELAEAGADELHNLCYAMNHYQGIHSTAYAKAMYNKLNNAVKDARGNYARAQQNIKDALKDMKQDVETGEKFW